MDISGNSIETIIRDKVIIEKLKAIDINTIGELKEYSRKELMEKQIEQFYIKDIVIALQCNGLDLRSNNRKRKGA